MRGDILRLLDAEAKKRPAIAELVARVADLTDAEIDGAKVPLPWFRVALRKLRAQKALDLLAASIDQHVVDGQIADPEGWLMVWQGGPTFLPLERGASMDVRDGEPLFLPDSGGYWIAHVFVPQVPEAVLRGSRRLRRETKGGYSATRQEWLRTGEARPASAE